MGKYFLIIGSCLHKQKKLSINIITILWIIMLTHDAAFLLISEIESTYLEWKSRKKIMHTIMLISFITHMSKNWLDQIIAHVPMWLSIEQGVGLPSSAAPPHTGSQWLRFVRAFKSPSGPLGPRTSEIPKSHGTKGIFKSFRCYLVILSLHTHFLFDSWFRRAFVTLDKSGAAVIRSASPSYRDKSGPYDCFRSLDSVELRSRSVLWALIVCTTLQAGSAKALTRPAWAAQ